MEQKGKLTVVHDGTRPTLVDRQLPNKEENQKVAKSRNKRSF